MRAALVAFAVLLVYANSLHGPFVLDDEAAIVQNAQIREWWRPGRVLVPDANSPVAGRPLVNVTFAINYAAGGLDVRGYHAVNIGLHLLCALLAFGVIRRTLRLPTLSPRFGADADDLACAAALLWAVHPLNSEVVDYLSQRSESTMAAFYLLTVYSASRALAESRKRSWEAAAVVTCALGMLCKEAMATAPAIVLLYDRAYGFPSWRAAFRERRRLYAGLAASWIIFAAVLVTAPRAGIVGSASGVSPWTYLLNQTIVITHYLRLSIWPDQLVAFYGWPIPLTLYHVLPYAVLLAALAAASIVSFARAPAFGFLGAWFFITLAPASSLVPVATEVGAERRMYLPLLALVVFAVAGWRAIWKATRPRVVVFVPLAVVAIALGAATIVRNREYGSALSLAQTVVERRPTGIAYHILGEQLMLGAREPEAVAPLTTAVALGDSRAGYPLGIALSNGGKLGEAVTVLDAFVRTSELAYRPVPRWLEPPRSEVVGARLLMARILASQRDWAAAGNQAERILTVDPGHVDAHRLLGQALINQGLARVVAGDINAAVDAFRRATAADPASARARELLGLALTDQAASENRTR
jgi:tetratricopeptide (TPR) repeat protein